MNLPSLRQDLADFRHFILHNFERLVAYDQGAYQVYYRGRCDPLPVTGNWKPYWGVNPAAEIVHFHGPKPDALKKKLDDPLYKVPDDWARLIERDPAAYRQYLALWESYDVYGSRLVAEALAKTQDAV